ncbi:MAG TPA: TRAP transporter TatT component family protein [Vicinamibacterales bacterium]|nr:TRAP transporter TatT component family protein [Vicinamibacterales bacterium]
MLNTWIAIALAVLAAGCSPKKMGVSRMADALSSTASAFTRDNDPEFVRQAAPSTLKMVEMMLDESPTHAGLLMTACSGFTQYAYAFLQADADVSDPSTQSAKDLKTRGAAMYDRARGYCLRALEIRHPGAAKSLQGDPKGLLASMAAPDVPALYWTGVSWGGGLLLSNNPLPRIGELITVRALLSRALQLNEAWEGGTIHEAMIAVESLPILLGGSAARAREHFNRAVALSNGESAFAYVALATGVAQPAKDRAEFERLLRAAIAIDVSKRPSIRLANLIAQKRARYLLSQVNKLF